MITGDLKNQVDKIWNDFWTGGVSNPLTVIEQFTYLIFLKRLDDKQLKKEEEENLMGIAIKGAIYTKEQKGLRWSQFKDKDPEVMFDLFTRPQKEFGGITVFDFMKTVGREGGIFSDYMKGATFMIPTPQVLDKVVQKIDKLPLDSRDTKGDIYEYMLSKLSIAGKAGQFRTPKHIIRMMVQMMDPKKDDIISDPACGTAGFLVSAGEYLYEKHYDWFKEEEFRKHYDTKMFVGTEFDASMLRIAAMNLQLHGVEHPSLVGKDALSKSNGDVDDAYTLILANPPFKGSLDYDTVESSLLKTTKTKKTELLFLSLLLRTLKTGGRAAVIVPDGVLFGSSGAHKAIREELVENQQLQGIISMPSGVFKPYAGVSTAILIFTKTNSGGTDKVWFYDMKADGYSLDDKRNALLEETVFEECFTNPQKAKEQVKEKCDIPEVLTDWQKLAKGEGNFEDRTSQSFLVPKKEIKDNGYDLSINRYKEIVYEEVEYEKPEELIASIKELDAERQEALSNLENMIG